MLLGPDEIALHIQHRHRPGWTIWYGRSTKRYWAMAAWVPGRNGFIDAPVPEALEAAIATIETLHPRPVHWGAHALGD